MIDDHPDLGPDPLVGRDPHPREQIDLWPLHDARQELLEEIVSQPGAGRPATTSRTSGRRFMVPVGIAAAIALVAGGAWFVVSSDDEQDQDQVVASSDATTDDTEVAVDPSAVATEEHSQPADPTVTPLSEVEEGDVLGPRQCRRFRHGNVAILVRKGDGRPRQELVVRLSELDRAADLRRLGRGKGWRIHIVRAGAGRGDGGNRVISVDKSCTVVAVDELRLRGKR